MATERVKAHFEEEAKEFDILIQKLIPKYNEMIDALVSVIPFHKEKRFSAADLGCGTGTVAKAVKDAFPNVKITCVDIAGNMLDIAKEKVGREMRYVQADLDHYEFDERYDLVVSSLALHHQVSDEDKMRLYGKVYSALSPNGMFVNADVVLGGDEGIQSVYMGKWSRFMERSFSKEEVDGTYLPRYYAEDSPAKMTSHLDMLKECGFSVVDVVYKHYNFAVYCAKK
ncbi:MAG: class I SAM-dependent methyltransferase [Methanomassiliicoccaceae archaeon]|jgi:tRNA (cmo5U34)-methyltransferase|nr:class I SAM-dependent methyltransferase [Methanomassiliicoccaceae archaeon]